MTSGSGPSQQGGQPAAASSFTGNYASAAAQGFQGYNQFQGSGGPGPIGPPQGAVIGAPPAQAASAGSGWYMYSQIYSTLKSVQGLFPT